MKRLVVALLLVAAAAYADRWQPSDRLRIANLNDPQISPDGKLVAVVVTRANVKENRWDGDLVVVDTATGEQRQLTYDRRGEAADLDPAGARRRSASHYRRRARRAAVRLEP